jgi:hypothetical protein
MDNVIRPLAMRVGQSEDGLIAVLNLTRHGGPEREFRWKIDDVPTIVGALLLCGSYEDVKSHSKFVQRVEGFIHLTDYQRAPAFKFTPDGAKNLALLLTKSLLRGKFSQ